MSTVALVEQKQIIISVADYCNDVLGKSRQTDQDDFLNDLDYVSIPFDRAEAIYSITRNQHTCHIQFPSEDSPELKQPLLWNFAAWVASIERHRKAKERSERERIANWIAQANVEIIKKAILRKFQFSESQATMLATKWLRENRVEKFLFLEVKLKTTVEEL